MNDHEEHILAGNDPDPVLLELTEQITRRLQAGERVDAGDVVLRYPQWAGEIRKLLPTMHDLVDYARAVDRKHKQHQVNPTDANDPNAESKEVFS
jgi:hypothetical protein